MNRRYIFGLLMGVSTLALPHTASAQTGAPSGEPTVLEDIVVTATRQSDAVSKVPLSVSAVDQKGLDRQSVKSVGDLARLVPSLTITGQNAGVATFSIRGIVSAGGATSATTGVYLDDVALQKRNGAGAFQNNGTPTPPLFDLERVEVLRGPQGTLFGGSSQGGTLRFITPRPSLTDYSAYVRSEVSSINAGEVGGELGVALGGPIVQDKLGFRVSAFRGHVPGYVDIVDPLAGGALRYKDVNSQDNQSFRGALLWMPVERASLGLSYFQSRQFARNASNSWTLPIAGTVTTPSYCYNRLPPTAVSPANPPTAVPCPAGAIPATMFQRPAQTYGPFPYLEEPYHSIDLERSPITTRLKTGSLSAEYDLGLATVKLISSFLADEAEGSTFHSQYYTNSQGAVSRTGVPYGPGSTVRFGGPVADMTSGFPIVPRQFIIRPVSDNSRHGVIHELRITSDPTLRPVSFVAGIYAARYDTKSLFQWSAPLDALTQATSGLRGNQRFTQRIPLVAGQTCANLTLPAGTPSTTSGGACFVGLDPLPGGVTNRREQKLTDSEIAGYGELNAHLSSKLRVIAGVRVSHVKFDYYQVTAGPEYGWNIPTVENTGITQGSISQSPVTPKVGVQYQVTDNDMLYATAAKGFRAGGVNTVPSVAICGAGLSAAGLTPADIPSTFGADTVWSYEGGGKFRLFGNRVQLNASAFVIDWSEVQFNVTLPGCGQAFILNAGAARSLGADFDVQARVTDSLLATLAIGYNKAEYTATATGPTPRNGGAATPVVQDGDKLPTPPWTVNLGLQYDFQVFGKLPAYFRGNYQYTAAYFRTPGPGVVTFAPDIRRAESTQQVNLRAGLVHDGLEFSLFVNNLTNSKDQLGLTGGRSACAPNSDPACANFNIYNPVFSATTLRPREIGLQASYRY